MTADEVSGSTDPQHSKSDAPTVSPELTSAGLFSPVSEPVFGAAELQITDPQNSKSDAQTVSPELTMTN